MSTSPHVFAFGKIVPQFVSENGSRKSANRSNFATLCGLSFAELVLKPGAFREPHWHANANELTYCRSGSALVTVFSNGNQHDSFTIGQGEMFFVPNGYLHSIENIGDDDAEFFVAFTDEMPEDFGMSGAVGCMSASVMGNTWNLPTSAAEGLRYSPQDIVFGPTDGKPEVPASAFFPNHYKLSLEAMLPLIGNEHGSVRVARKQFWPVLEGIAMYSLHISGTGMREPHWHPRTAEMGYVLTGRARMTLLSPGAKVDTYILEAGDMYFIPKAYPHHIENLENEETRFLIFFDQPMPEDIGYTGGLATFPGRIVAPTIGCTKETLPKIPNYPADLLLVEKVNPVTP